MTISIALTTYNGEKFIEKQIISLLKQTKVFNELIICDDNSSDSTLEIIYKYAKKDSRIKVYTNKYNIGFRKNFEKALSLTTGEYIALCDQDDIWLPDHIEVLLNGIGDKQLVCADALIIDRNDNDNGVKLSYLTHLCNYRKPYKDIFSFIYLYHNTFLGMTMMMRRSFLELALPIPDKANFHDSWFAFVAILKKSFVYIPRVVTLYRFHDNNVTGNYKRHPYIRSILAHWIHGHTNYAERSGLINDLMSRIGEEDKEVSLIIEPMRKYFEREKSFYGRCINLLYELIHYSKIY